MLPRCSPTFLCVFLTIGTVAIGSALLVAWRVSNFGPGGSSPSKFLSAEHATNERPSSTPSSTPSFRPSLAPSDAPSDIPSFRPSLSPTLEPSSSPTKIPSTAPSTTPSLLPSAFPSGTPTSSPTRMRISRNYAFSLKLFWNNYFWQEENFEREWCLECATCVNNTEYGLGDGCIPGSCSLGDQIWVQRCGTGKGNAVFNLIQGDGEADQIKVKGTNLCLERKTARRIVLSPCQEGKLRQLWVGFQKNAPFDLHPIQHMEKCVTQHHHPKGNELIYAESCRLAHHYDSGLWEVVYGK